MGGRLSLRQIATVNAALKTDVPSKTSPSRTRLVVFNDPCAVTQVKPRLRHELDGDTERCLGNKKVIGRGDQPFHPQVSCIPFLNVKFETVKNGHFRCKNEPGT